ncbi:MAG TPA: hypothetical protein VMB79_03115 [Jatrophihabitans sp.]|nr:hypothetical protein [Jatrophihabitans sp.]
MTTTFESVTDRQLTITDQARATVGQLAEGGHRIAILLDWPTDPATETFAGFEPADDFEPDPCDAIIGHVEGCPVYVDLRQRNTSRTRQVSLELDQDGALRLHGQQDHATASWAAARSTVSARLIRFGGPRR